MEQLVLPLSILLLLTYATCLLKGRIEYKIVAVNENANATATLTLKCVARNSWKCLSDGEGISNVTTLPQSTSPTTVLQFSIHYDPVICAAKGSVHFASENEGAFTL